MSRPTAIIIGAGPAGLTAASELLRRGGIRPIVLEKDAVVGGLSRTVHYKGNRIDIGGHRFFSKSDRVMQWWLERLPLEAGEGSDQPIQYQGQSRTVEQSPRGPNPRETGLRETGLREIGLQETDDVMLLRSRRSRIFYRRMFFDYPISLGFDTIRKLGLPRMVKIGLSYARSMLWPIRHAETLEQFFINRFGRELYRTFFESYTEKVWGIPCNKISAQWGAQRIKGLSISKALWHAIKKPFTRRDVAQKGTETSLIEQFLYPKFGPGQMWERVADEVTAGGGEVLTNQEVRRVEVAGNHVTAVEVVDSTTGESRVFHADYFLSTMPVQQLVRSLSPTPPEAIRRVSEGLVYRDFITVGVLLDKLKVNEPGEEPGKLIRDNWIYIQEPDVVVGRLQIFNNWSPHMVADPSKVWVGMEYFCNEHDDLWVKPDHEITTLAVEELAKLGIIDAADVLDTTVIKMPKTYPAYFGTYDRFGELQNWLDAFENLFLIGRNGMHRYNNMDHSMLTAMAAVDNILTGRTDKSNIWSVNVEREYHEEKVEQPVNQTATEPPAPLVDEPQEKTLVESP